MANLDPWSYASKTSSEHAEQVALFMWANMAMRFGPNIANDPHSYNVKGFALEQFKGKGGLGYIRYSETLPQLKWLHAISNHGAGFGRKAEGVKKGVSDIFLPVPRYVGLVASRLHGTQPCAVPETNQAFCGLYIELKRRDTANQKAGKPSPEQLEFQTDMRAAGYACALAYGWEQARDQILRYLGLTA